MMKKFAVLCVTLLTTAIIGGNVQAGAMLSDLINGGSLTVGDKLFTNWSASNNEDEVNLADISVTGDNSDSLNPGLIYSIANGALTAADPDFFDLDISFTVSTLGGQPWITGTSLSLTGFDAGLNKDGLISIQELAGFPKVEFDTLPPGVSTLSDSNTLGAPVNSLNVSLNVIVFSFDPNPIALTEFQQHFAQSQAPAPVVPEPSTFAVWSLLGLAGLGCSRRRNRTTLSA